MKIVFEQAAEVAPGYTDADLESAMAQLGSFLIDSTRNKGAENPTDRKPELALDLGSGIGASTGKLLSLGYSVYALDFSERMMTLCRQNYAANPDLKTDCRDVRFLSLEKNSAQVAWLNDLICYLKPEEVQRVIQTLFGILKSKGILSLYWIEGHGEVEDRPWSLEGPTRTRRRWNEKAVCSLIEQTGFQVKKIGRLVGRPESVFLIAEKII